MQKQLNKVGSIKGMFVRFFLLALFSGCHLKPEKELWQIAGIDPRIKSDSGYLALDNQKEVFSFGDKTDSTFKRSSGIAYSSNDLPYNDAFAHLNNCRAYFHTDTLAVIIGIGNGFSGEGFVIRVKNGKFYTRPYHYTDVVSRDKKPVYKIVYQKLILDKLSYNPGDSVYGRIDFKSIESNGYFNKVEHTGTGLFRTRIK